MDKSDYVSLEAAKLLKEKGYPQDCEVGTICRLQNEANRLYENTRAVTQSDLDNAWCVFNEVYPSLYEAQKWLIYERGWFVDVSKGTDGWHTIIYPTEPNASCAIILHQNYDTYEQALSEGITNILKSI